MFSQRAHCIWAALKTPDATSSKRSKSTSPESKAGSLAATLDHLALVEKALGNYSEALRLSLQSLVQYQALVDSAEEAMCLNNLGSLSLAMRDSNAASSYLRQGLVICERDGIVSTRGFILANLAEVALRGGDLTAAETASRDALEAATTTGNRAVASWVKTKLACVAARRGDLATARSILAEGLITALELGLPSIKFDALRAFAELLVAQGETRSARLRAGLCGKPPENERSSPRRYASAARTVTPGSTERSASAHDGSRRSASSGGRGKQDRARTADRHVAGRSDSSFGFISIVRIRAYVGNNCVTGIPHHSVSN